MKTIRTKVYSFNELSETAQQTAIENYRYSDFKGGYYWGNEVINSVEKGLEHFGAELKRYSIDWDNINCSDWKIEFPEHSELQGVRLWKYLHNNNLLTYFNKYQKKQDNLLDGNCPFTGVCFDEDFLDNIREFVKKPNNTTFEELLKDAVYNCFNSGCKDWEYLCSDAAIKEELENSDIQFLSNGNVFNY